MWIKKLILTNWQKHSHLELEFSDKLNIIHGGSDCGKSCILRALGWIFYNNIKGDIIRKEGTKKTSVRVTLDNGVEIERIKSASVNAYIIYKNGEEQRFDSVGKTIPEEVQKELQVTTLTVDKEDVILNIANQISLPFLVGRSATFRSKLFNKLTGSELIDKAFQSLNKDILRIGKETKLETEHLKEQEKRLEELTTQKEKTDILYSNAKKVIDKLKELQEKYDRLNDLYTKLNNIGNDLNDVEEKISKVKIIPKETVDNIRKDIEELIKYNEYIERIKANKEELKSLKEIKIPDINISDLKKQYERLQKLQELQKRLRNSDSTIAATDTNVKKYKELIIASNKQKDEILKNIKSLCPFFKVPCPLDKENKK